MEFEITARDENALLEREELTLSIDHAGDATPSEADVRSALAAQEDLDPETVRIDHIYSSYGAARSEAVVTVFDEPVVDLSDDAEAPEDAAEDDADADEEQDEDPDEADDEPADEDEQEEDA